MLSPFRNGLHRRWLQFREPELRFLLRLASQFPSQKRELLRQTWFGFEAGSLLCRSRIQSAHPFFDENATEVRPLGSTDITPLHRYYGPLRLPTAAAGQVMDSLPALSRQLSRRAPRRISQVPVSIWRRALSPITPDGSVDALARCFSTDSRLHHLWQAGRRRVSVTRPNRVHLR